MATAMQLLDLPAEILLLIAESVPHESLLQMRLACKELENAALKPFTKEYVTSLDCFVLDSAKLKRIQNILARPRLSHRVQKLELNLTVCANYYRQVNLAPGKGLDRSTALFRADEFYSLEHCQTLLDRPVPWDSIRDVLRSIASSSDAVLGLDLVEEESTCGRILSQHPTLARDLLEAAIFAGCSLGELGISNKSELISPTLADNLDSDESNVYVDQIVSSLTEFSLEAEFSTERDLNRHRPASQQSFALAKKILAQSQTLKSLALWIEGHRHQRSIDEFTRLTPNLLKNAHLRALEIINLNKVRFHSQDLFHLISQCSTVLTEVELIEVTLLDDGDPWLAVLRGLRACSKLSKLDLKDGAKHGSFESRSRMRMLASDDCKDARYSSFLSAHGSKAVRQLLDINIERGPRYG